MFYTLFIVLCKSIHKLKLTELCTKIKIINFIVLYIFKNL